ncbi:hypothetical protein MBLNU13_g02644t1 [Cladosporium sp. NU13]
MFGFCLARTPYLAVDTYSRKKATLGEWFCFRQPFYRAGIILHLAVVIPAGVLAAVQFTPVLRRKVLVLYRINGYVLISLVTLAYISGLMVARRSFGGTVETQMFVGLLASATTVSMATTWTNINRLQIEQRVERGLEQDEVSNTEAGERRGAAVAHLSKTDAVLARETSFET